MAAPPAPGSPARQMVTDIPGWGPLHMHTLIDNDPTVFAATVGTAEVSVVVSPTAAGNAANERAVMERLMCAAAAAPPRPRRR